MRIGAGMSKIFGANVHHNLSGTNRNDQIFDRGRQDFVQDVVDGSGGNNRIYGGDGSDGVDTVYGDEDNCAFDGGAGKVSSATIDFDFTTAWGGLS
jgi:hypothetical protein